MSDLFSVAIIFIFGILGGILFDKIKLPRLVYYLILGILLGPSVFCAIMPGLENISDYLRQIALIIILTRSGLSLDFKTLKQIGRPAILLCFLPATFEIIGVTLIAYFVLKLAILEGLLMGAVLAAVSPAIVVPRMIKFIDEGYSKDKNLPSLVMAGASCDDIYVIILFYVFKNLLTTSNSLSNLTTVALVPVGIIIGILVGVIFAFILLIIFKFLKPSNVLKIILTLGMSILLIELTQLLSAVIYVQGMLGIIVMAMIIYEKDKESTFELKEGYNRLWIVFELFLFVLIGSMVDMSYVFSINGLKVILVLFIGLIFRTVGTYLSIIGMKYTFKEKIFILISYIPKATVQASIGAIALSCGLSCGTVVLTVAFLAILITAPLGGILIDKLTPKLLSKD